MTKQPSYRFVGYTEPWGEKKLGEVGDFSIKTNSFSREKLSLNSGEIKNIHYGDILVKYNSTLDFENNSIPYVIDNDTKLTSDMFLKNGDIIFSDAAEDYSVGKCVELFNVSGNIVSGLHTIVCRPEIDFARYFLGYYLNSNSYRQQVLPMVQGAKVSSISKGNLSKTNISFPSLPEQTAIGSFFQDIDQLISLQHRKLEVLKEQKKTYLKLLFPAKGQTKPALRFVGFEDDWKEVKLGDLILRGGSGGTPKSTVAKYYGGDIPFLSITDISNSGKYLKKTEKTITNEGLQNSSAWVVPEGAISLAMYASVGKLAILGIDCATSQAFYNMVFEDDIVRNFVYITLEKANIYNEWGSLISTGTQANLNAEKVKNFSFLHPRKSEQEAIGSFFQDLDKAIAKQEEKVSQLKESKQTLLRKMFI